MERRLAALLEGLLERPPPDAVEAVAERRVVRIWRGPVERWAVIGRTGDYLVIPMLFCSCPAFTARFAVGLSDRPCYHLVAVELARRRGGYVDVSGRVDGKLLAQLVAELLYQRRSPTLRRLLGW